MDAPNRGGDFGGTVLGLVTKRGSDFAEGKVCAFGQFVCLCVGLCVAKRRSEFAEGEVRVFEDICLLLGGWHARARTYSSRSCMCVQKHAATA